MGRTPSRLIRFVASSVVLASVASSGAAPSVSAAGTPRPASPYGTTVVVDGRGYGHGIGLSQYGALGYAVDDGWTADQILGHYYGNTSPGAIANDELRVRLTELDDQQTVVVGTALVTTADAGAVTWKSVVIRPDAALGPRGSQVWARADAQVCAGAADDLAAGGWTRLPDQGDTRVAPVDVAVPGETPSTAVQDLAAVCLPSGTVRSYRGILRAVAGSTDERRTVNAVPIESYLRGVVPSEVPAGWAGLGGGRGAEALKAQAVAARSYARVQSRYTYAQTCDTQACQVYSGAARRTGPAGAITAVEHPNTDAAIAATAGVVRVNGVGTVVSTMFSSSSGGYTAPSVSPGFPAVPDDGDDVAQNGNHTWQSSISVTDVEAQWPTIGTLTQITVTRRNGLGADGGRVLEMVITGTAGRVTKTGDDFRLAFDLKSNWFTVRGDLCSGRVEPEPTGATIPSTQVGMVPIAPSRVIDTRNGIGTAAVALGAGCTLAFDPGTRPFGAIAAALVLTATRADGNGFTTAYPCGTTRPTVSAVQILGGLDIPGTTVVPLGTQGRICIYSSVTTDVLVDVMGWLAPTGQSYTATTSPQRLLDSRQPAPRAVLAAGAETAVQVPSVDGVIPTSASINLTATGSTGAGYVTAYPCDQTRSETSVLNVRRGADIANHVFVDLDAQGRFCLFNSVATHLIADLDGSFGSVASARPVRVQAPSRVIDSRNGVGTTGPIPAETVRALDLGDASGGVLAELTIVDPAAGGYAVLYPCDDPTAGGGTSVVNTARMTNVANLVLMRTDVDGQVCLRTTMSTHVLVDVIGRV